MSTPWWHGAVIYHVYPLSFSDSDGDGFGDLPGLLSRLDYVAGLGVDAIWISPFYPSPMKDFGYDITDHCDVHPAMGTLDDFDAIVRRAHTLGLKVLIDQVWSHTSDQHPWFQDSRMARESAASERYVWADPRPDGTPPNNWLSVFGGSAWTWSPVRRQYYLHHFLSSQPALNLRSDVVVAALFACARFWLDRGVDGFRFDAVDFMFHDVELRDNPPRPPADGMVPPRPFRLQHHVHDMMGTETRDFLCRLGAVVRAYDGVVTLGELSSEEGALERCAAYTSPAGTALDIAYTLGMMKQDFTPEVFARALAAVEHTSGIGNCWAFSNHDVARACSRWGGAHGGGHFACLLMALLLSLPGTVCLYQGEELGLPQAEIPESRLRDPFGTAFYPVFTGRDGSRTPMPWTAAGRHAGFSSARNAWLPVPRAHRERAVDRQAGDARSLLSAWRNFLRWRRAHPSLVRGTLTALRADGSLLSFERVLGEERVLAAFNFSDKPATLPVENLTLTPLGSHAFATDPKRKVVVLQGYGVLFARLAAGSPVSGGQQGALQTTGN
ncbi:MAG: alpha-glucosidase [Alphaproteobacteria bacterium]|nr:alpha-glucosidase [Alphaproteobacteria bacterium]